MTPEDAVVQVAQKLTAELKVNLTTATEESGIEQLKKWMQYSTRPPGSSRNKTKTKIHIRGRKHRHQFQGCRSKGHDLQGLAQKQYLHQH